MPIYYPRDQASDLTGGATFTDAMRHSHGPSTLKVVTLGPFGSETNWTYTEPGLPGNARWRRADWTGRVTVGAASGGISLKLRLYRVSRDGVVIESGPQKGPYVLTAGSSTDYEWAQKDWGAGRKSERIGVEWSFTNGVGSNQNVRMRWDDYRTFIATPIPERVLVPVLPPRVGLYNESLVRMGTLTTASRVDRSYLIKGVGAAYIEIARTDPLFEQCDPRRGRFVVIESEAYPVPWVGPILKQSEVAGGGRVALACKQFEGVLDRVKMPDNFELAGTTAHVADKVMQLANSDLRASVRTGLAEPSPLEWKVSFAHQPVRRALDMLARASGQEWWLEHDTSGARIDTWFQMRRWRGEDHGSDAELASPGRCQWRDWTIDGEAVAYALTVLGGQSTAVQSVSDRPSASPSVDDLIPQEGPHGYTILAPPTSLQGLSRSHKLELVSHLKQRGQVALASKIMMGRQRSDGWEQKASLSAYMQDGTLTPKLRVGNVIRLRLPDAFGSGYDGWCRILGVQPDEAGGDMDMRIQLLGPKFST